MEALSLQTYDIVVYPNRKRLFWARSIIVLAFLLMIGMDGFAIWAFGNHYHIDAGAYVAAVMLPIGTLYMGAWVTLMLLYGLRWRGPAIMINSEGLSMGFPLRLAFSRPIRQSFIPWEEIEWISSFRDGMLSLSLKDPAHYWSLYGHGKYRRWRRHALTGAHININQYSLSLSAAQILQRIEEHYSSELLKYEVQMKQ
jgi:hypothetical protein